MNSKIVLVWPNFIKFIRNPKKIQKWIASFDKQIINCKMIYYIRIRLNEDYFSQWPWNIPWKIPPLFVLHRHWKKYLQSNFKWHIESFKLAPVLETIFNLLFLIRNIQFSLIPLKRKSLVRDTVYKCGEVSTFFNDVPLSYVVFNGLYCLYGKVNRVQLQNDRFVMSAERDTCRVLKLNCIGR